MSQSANQVQYSVVRNHEEQYSIWLVDKPMPLGWQAVGFEGSKEQCVEFVEKVWHDMRPLSLRQAMKTPQSQAE